MAVNLTIDTISEFDYDDNPVNIKNVTAAIDGEVLKEVYCFPDTTSDTVIQSAVEADLEAKGYDLS